MTERIETVTQITNTQLKAGGFAFQLPETATTEDRDAFSKLVHTTKESGLNLILDPSVKVIDLKAPVVAPAPVVAEVPQAVVEAVPAPTTVEVPAPAPVVPAAPEAPVAVPVQQPMYIVGMPSWNQAVPQPMMQQPQPMMYPYMFPYNGLQPQVIPVAPVPQPEKK